MYLACSAVHIRLLKTELLNWYCVICPHVMLVGPKAKKEALAFLSILSLGIIALRMNLFILAE